VVETLLSASLGPGRHGAVAEQPLPDAEHQREGAAAELVDEGRNTPD